MYLTNESLHVIIRLPAREPLSTYGANMANEEMDLWSDVNNPNNDADMDDWSDAHNPNNDDYLGDD